MSEQTAVQAFLTGERVLVGSTNVLAMLYHAPTAKLYVEYKPHRRKTARRRGGKNYTGPYAYANVSPAEAEHFYKAGSKGKWVWSYLRVRGSATAHRKKFVKAPLPIKPSVEALKKAAGLVGGLMKSLVAALFA